MGLLSTIGTVATVGTNVASGVFNLGKGIVSGVYNVGKGISKSLIGKFALGAIGVGILTSDPTGKGNSLFSKAASGFKSFIGAIGSSVSNVATKGALGAAALTEKVGTNANKAVDALGVAESGGVGLRDAVIDNAPVSFSHVEPVAEQAPQAAASETHVEEAPGVQAELC